MRLAVAAAAAADLGEAAAWYESRKRGLGSEFLAAVCARLDSISENPHRCPIGHGSSRRALVTRFPYCVLYRIDADRILVVAILHVGRDPGTAIRREE